MRAIEVILYVVIALAIGMKLGSISGADLLFILSSAVLAMLYFPGAPFAFRYKRSYSPIGDRTSLDQPIIEPRDMPAKSLTLFHSLSLGFALAITLLGIVFKVQRWMGAAPMFFLGLGVLSIMLLVSLIGLGGSRSKAHRWAVVRILLIGGLGAFLAFGSSSLLMKLTYSDRPEYIEAYEAWQDDPTDIDALKRLQRIEEDVYHFDRTPEVQDSLQ